MHPSKFALKNPTSVYLLTFIIIVMGILSYKSIPREATPDIQIPMLIVSIVFPGASPEDVESLITRKVELELQDLDKLKSIKSTSAENIAAITLEFTQDFNISDARTKVREALDKVKSDLPADALDPVLTEINLSEQPMLMVNLSGEIGLMELKEISEKLKDRIETLSGILEVRRIGGLEREIRVYVNPERLQFYNLGLPQISNAISGENLTLPGGTITMGPSKYMIRIPGEFETPQEIEEVMIASNAQRPILVKDVARVVFGFKELSTRSRLNGKESVSLSVIKKSGANLLAIREVIKSMVAEYQEEYKGQVTFTILADQGTAIERFVTDLENNIITGFLLVFIVLWIFMGIVSALLIAISIPLSFLMSMVILEAMGFTLNMVVLFSLILSLGMLVNNAIVVIENIYRYMQAGKSRMDAAETGTLEVAIPIITSTLTTLAAFAPIIFMPGIIGGFIKYLPQTLIVTLSCSLFIGLIINPVMAYTLLSVKKKGDSADELEMVQQSKILQGYRRILESIMRHRTLSLMGIVAIFMGVSTLYVTTTLKERGVEFLPSSEPTEAVIHIKAASGLTLEEADRLVKTVERMVAPHQDSTKSIIANVGQGRGGSGTTGSSESHVVMTFPDWQNWVVRPSELLEQVREKLKSFTGAEVKLSKQSNGPPTGPPINIELRGESFSTMLEQVELIKQRIKEIPGLVNLTDDFDRNRPEIRVLIDRKKINGLGLRTLDVSMMVRTAINGTKVSELRENKEEYEIYVQMDSAFRENLTDIQTLNILTPFGKSIPLSELATIQIGPAYGAIRHVGLDRVITISADTSGVAGPVLLKQVQTQLAGMIFPKGYTISYTGENEDMQESQAFLIRSFGIAVFLIFLVLVTQFNSMLVPFVILSSVILSLIGIFGGLMIHNSPFSVIMTGIGTVSLAGIVVNNAIVLIDYIQHLRKRGIARDEAVVLAGMVRLRPVLLTAITTILGLLPVAMGMDINFFRWPIVILGGESGTFWQPMAFAVIYGLAVSTLLTLIAVPLLYSSVYAMKDALGRSVHGLTSWISQLFKTIPEKEDTPSTLSPYLKESGSL